MVQSKTVTLILLVVRKSNNPIIQIPIPFFRAISLLPPICWNAGWFQRIVTQAAVVIPGVASPVYHFNL